VDYNAMVERHIASVKEIIARNPDLPERLSSPLAVEYDRDEDLLIITLDTARDSVTESARNRLFFTVAVETLRIISIEVPHVSNRLEDDKMLRSFIRRYLPTIVEPTWATAAAQEIREMVS
jgi:hypothetical protein